MEYVTIFKGLQEDDEKQKLLEAKQSLETTFPDAKIIHQPKKILPFLLLTIEETESVTREKVEKTLLLLGMSFERNDEASHGFPEDEDFAQLN